jgi:hypothetical protein
VQKRARRRAALVLTEVVHGFERIGYDLAGRPAPLRARLTADERPELRLALVPIGGRIFGGTFALEVSTAEAPFPPTGGVSARGRGAVALKRIDFHAKRSDAGAGRLAERLGSDRALFRALSAVHFEQIRIDPDGRPMIRHMGGSLVWLLFPPMARPVPLVAEQVQATVASLEAFINVGRANGGAATL